MVHSFVVIAGNAWISVAVVVLLLSVIVSGILCRFGKYLQKQAHSQAKALYLLGAACLEGIMLWACPLVLLFMVSPERLAFLDKSLLLAALFLCMCGAIGLQALLSKKNVDKAKLAVAGVLFSGFAIAVWAWIWNSLRFRLLLPHEANQAFLLGLCVVVTPMLLSASLWLPVQTRSRSLKIQSMQAYLSPLVLGLALFSLNGAGMVLSSFLPLVQPPRLTLLYPVLGGTVINYFLLAETLTFGLILFLLAFYRFRERQEQKLQFRNILSSNAIGTILCDFDGHILCVNNAFLEIVGYERAEFEQKALHLSDMTPLELDVLDQHAIAALKTHKMVVDYEKQLLRQDGQTVDVLIAGLSQVEGYEDTAMGYVLDITEKKKALLGVQENEARFRQLAASNLIGIVFWNIYGSIDDANDVFLSLLGYSREDLQAGEINWRKLILPQDEVTQASMVRKAIAGEKVEPYETVFIHKNGNLIDVQVVFAMLHGAREAGFSFVQDISERKRAETALLENYQRINLILEAIPHKVWTAEASGQSNYSNKNLLQYSGITQEELNVAGWGIYLHPDDVEATIASWNTAVRTGQAFEEICRIRRYDGYYRWHLSTAHPVYDQAGQLILWVGTNTDIHEMKLAQERIKESERRFRLMAEQSPIMIWLTDAEGVVSYINARLSEFMEFIPQEALQSQWLDRIHVEDVISVQQTWEHAFKNQTDFEVTFRQFQSNGEERWVSASGNPIHSEEGEFWGFVGTIVDITDQKRLQEKLEAEVLSRTNALQENMTLLHSIFENVPAIIFLKDAKELRFKLCNKVGRELFGFVGEEYLNKTDYDFFPKEQADLCISKDRETLLSRQLVDIPEEWLQTTRGDQCLLHMKKVPILDKQGNPAYVLVVAEDITEFKKNQDQILDLNLKLQKQVQTISEAHKALESFSYSVSHDLRAPLRTIDGYSQVVLENYSEKLDDTGKHYLARVREGSQQMAKLIDDMLNLSRLSRSELKKEKVNLSELVRLIAQDLQHNEAGREVEFIIEEGLFANADKRLIQSVLQNLIGNAWKFTSHHPRALIEFGKLHDYGQPVYFVRDNGAGFDMAYADKLFGTFQRLHSASEFPGTGIGLASVQRIIQKHGGEIWAQGVVEEGATFYFTL